QIPVRLPPCRALRSLQRLLVQVLDHARAPAELVLDAQAQAVGRLGFAMVQKAAIRRDFESAQPAHDLVAVGMSRKRREVLDFRTYGHVFTMNLDLGSAVHDRGAAR